SPPRITATRLLSVTDLATSVGLDFHQLAQCAQRRTGMSILLMISAMLQGAGEEVDLSVQQLPIYLVRNRRPRYRFRLRPRVKNPNAERRSVTYVLTAPGDLCPDCTRMPATCHP
ncbi:MAG: hypothetical protein ABIJ42_07965, partial [Acidobacteriota bacterium]